MRIALAQINPHLGNFEYNAKKICEYIERAKDRRCDIVLFPEASLFGYHPMDLLTRSSIVQEQIKFIEKIKDEMPKGILAVFGAITENKNSRGKPYFNSAVALQKNKKIWIGHKELLPTYDVFDDARHIEPGDLKENILTYKGKKLLVTICEDIWAWPSSRGKRKTFYESNPIKKIKPGTIDLVLNLSASPYFLHKIERRHSVVLQVCEYLKAPAVYVNVIGGQDELVFDGGSFAMSKSGKIIAQCAQFVEDLGVVDFDKNTGTQLDIIDDSVEGLRNALVVGISDFVRKTGLKKVHFGLSGGIDSALVACLAVDALGASAVHAVAMPGPYSSSKSYELARKLSKNLGIQITKVNFNSEYKKLSKLMNAHFGRREFGLSDENLQARIRALILMYYSNRENSLLLNTTNKSEMAAGYGTLYGDMAGGLSPIGDLLKRDVYALAKYYNKDHELIPKEIINRAPTAELRANQKDQDTLPPYNHLDESVVALVEHNARAKTKSDMFLLRALMLSEFKRWQAPPILKVREHSFGQGRRMPIAHKALY